MVDAGTKYLAISFRSLSGALLLGLTEIFRLMMPSKHLCPKSNTPDPEFPVVAISLITVENLRRALKGRNAGNMIWERAVASGTATMTGSPGHGWFSHSGMRRICR